MFSLLSSILLMTTVIQGDIQVQDQIVKEPVVIQSQAKDQIVYNETTKVFEIATENLQNDQIEKSWNNLNSYIVDQFNDNEKIEKFSVVKGFSDDFTYLKNKKNYLSVNSLDMLKQWSEKTQKSYSSVENTQVLTPQNITQEMKKKLILEAQRARTFAYAPYSQFHVGAAILTKDGKIYSGCNFENASYGCTICAERAAIAKACSYENRGVSFQKNQSIIAVAVVIRGGGGSPCGNCRQVLNEFNPDMLVIMSDIDAENIIEKPLSDLLPMGFGPSNLEKSIVK